MVPGALHRLSSKFDNFNLQLYNLKYQDDMWKQMSLFPGGHSDNKIANQFATFIDWHWVLNNNRRVLHLRSRSWRWRRCRSIEPMHGWHRESHTIHLPNICHIMTYGTLDRWCSVRIHQSCMTMATSHVSNLIYWSSDIDSVAAGASNSCCTMNMHQ